MKVFISYSTEDGIDHAKKLWTILEKRGHDPFLYSHGCASEIIWDKIGKEIANRELSIFVITKSSMKSNGQKKEYDLANAKYRRMMAFESEKASEMNFLENIYPFLLPSRNLVFNKNNLENKCEIIFSDLVKLQDRECSIEEKEITKNEKFPELMLTGLDKPEINKCIEKLFDSYQAETIIPDTFSTNVASKSTKLVNLGFNYRLPREWFLSYDITNKIFSNEFMFQGIGRNIALSERKFLNDQIIDNSDVLHIQGSCSNTKDLLNTINKAISALISHGSTPVMIFPTIEHMVKIYKLSREHHNTQLEFSKNRPRPILDPTLTLEGRELKLLQPLGKIQTKTMVFSSNTITWLLKKYPKYGSLYIDVGNDPFYPKRFVNVIALTTLKCKINNPKGIAVIDNSTDITNNSK